MGSEREKTQNGPIPEGKRYDNGYWRFWDEYAWPIIGVVGALRPLHFFDLKGVLDLREGQNLLEIGSGYGFYQFYSKDVGETGTFVALDANNAIQKRAKRLSDLIDKFRWERSSAKEQFIIGDKNILPFSDASFDLIVANNCWYGQETFLEVLRVLKPGGKIAISWLEPFIFPIFASRQKREAINAGFANTRLRLGTPALNLVSMNWTLIAQKPDVE